MNIFYLKQFGSCLSFLKQRKKFAFEVLKFYQTDTAIYSLATFEEKNCRNAAYSVLSDNFIVFVNIEFADYRLVSIFFQPFYPHSSGKLIFTF